MPEPEQEQSFSYMVARRAWFAAWAFFESKFRDAVLFVCFLATGGFSYWRLYGFPATKEQVVPVLIFTVGPMVALWVLLFVWHLWLAPSALTYEAARAAAARAAERPAPLAPPREPLGKPINWAIWKHRATYNLDELSSILAKSDPSSEANTADRRSFLRLLQEDVMSGKLPVTRDRHAESHQTPDLWPSYFDVQKAAAVAWAKGKDFDLSHIE